MIYISILYIPNLSTKVLKKKEVEFNKNKKSDDH